MRSKTTLSDQEARSCGRQPAAEAAPVEHRTEAQHSTDLEAGGGLVVSWARTRAFPSNTAPKRSVQRIAVLQLAVVDHLEYEKTRVLKF